MPRSQQRLELRLVDAATLDQRVLLTENSDTWIDLNDDLRFLPGGKRFIWGSDRSGYHHLYLYDLDGHLLARHQRRGHGTWTACWRWTPATAWSTSAPTAISCPTARSTR